MEVPIFWNDKVKAKNIEDFLNRYYRPERFHGRGEEYAQAVIKSAKEHFAEFGYDIITHHSSVTGQTVSFFGNPPVMPTEEQCPRREYISESKQ